MASSLVAQNESDVFRYTWLMPTGTPRFTALGGAMGALGGDLSTVTVNPAGIGIYRKGQCAFGLGVSHSNVRSEYYGSEARESRTGVNLPAMGFVTVSDVRKKDRYLSGWQFVNFALTYNRTGDFNFRGRLLGNNTESSFIRHFRDMANQMGPPQFLDPFYEELLLRTQVLLYDTASGSYYDFAEPWPGVSKKQDFYYNSWGSLGELGFNVAANYGNRFYFGGGLNIVTGTFRQFIRMNETDPGNLTPEFSAFTLEQRLQSTVGGVNVRAGIIVRPMDWVRLGVSVQSPTWLSLRDRYSNQAAAAYDNGAQTGWYESPFGTFNYRITTPFKVTASAGFIIMRMAALGVDYEFTDLSTARLNTGMFFNNVNPVIRAAFNTRHTLRAGLELKLDPVYLRGGFQYLSNGYQPSFNNFETWGGSAGLGFRLGRWTLDAGYNLYRVQPMLQPYQPTEGNPVRPARLTHHLHGIVWGGTFNF
ncbi:MAG: hypothetical protein N2050_00050 [Flavobacteriales bacterium]|nr:hypothetical protein [Flavobacteriales bacterium]